MATPTTIRRPMAPPTSTTPTALSNPSAPSTSTSIEIPTVFVFDTSLSRRRYLEIIGSLPSANVGTSTKPNSIPASLGTGASSSSNIGSNAAPGKSGSTGGTVPAGAKGELGEIVKRIMKGTGGKAPPVGGHAGLAQAKGKGKGNDREGDVAVGRQPRFSIIITSPSPNLHPTANPSGLHSFVPPSSSPIVHSQYFLPLDVFWPALPSLAGLFPAEGWCPPGGGRGGAGQQSGRGKDGPQTGGSGSGQDRTGGGMIDGPEEDDGLLEGLIAALETFDLHARNPFGRVGKGDALSPFATRSPSAIEIERYLVLFTGRDPALFLEERPAWIPTKGNEIDTRSAELERTPANPNLPIDPKKSKTSTTAALTGLISPSPSPEDRAQQLQTLSPTKRDAATALHKRADHALRRRVRSNWVKAFDGVTWPTVAEEFRKRDVQVGAVFSGFGNLGNGDGLSPVGSLTSGPGEGEAMSGSRWIGCVTGMMDKLYQQDRAMRDESERASAWWTLVQGSRVVLSNWHEHRPETIPVATGRDAPASSQDEKNINGKRPFAAASPLEQDLETEAKRFKAVAAQRFAMNNSPAHKLTPSPAMQASMSNLTAAQMAVVNEAIVEQARMEKAAAEQLRRQGAQNAVPPRPVTALSATYTEMQQKTYGADPATLSRVAAPPMVSAPAPNNGNRGRQSFPVWKGRILTSPPKQDQNGVMLQPDIRTMPVVTALALSPNGNMVDYAPESWPQQFLSVSHACRRDMQALQTYVQSQCVFVDFRPDTGPNPGPQPNLQAFASLATKLVNADVMLVCRFGPVEGGGVILAPHRTNESQPWKLLGACFFKSRIPPEIMQAQARPPGPPPQIIQNVQQYHEANPGPGPLRSARMPAQRQNGPPTQQSRAPPPPQNLHQNGNAAPNKVTQEQMLTEFLTRRGHDPAMLKNLPPATIQAILQQAANSNWGRTSSQEFAPT